MPNVSAVLNEHIRRLAGREINQRTQVTRRLSAQFRRDIAALKRRVAELLKSVAFLASQEKKRGGTQPAVQDMGDVRFRADGLRTHRKKLGLSAREYGKLVGVAGKTIYFWEAGTSRPRKAQLARLVAVRGIGKREAMKRLELLGESA